MRMRRKVGWSGEYSNPLYMYREHHPKPDAEGLARELTEKSSEGSGLLKQPRVIDAVPFDFMSGEVVERKGAPAEKFRGQLTLTNDDVTVRRPSDAILVIDNYKIVAISDGKTRLEPR